MPKTSPSKRLSSTKQPLRNIRSDYRKTIPMA
jgi:hypothetical protein